MKLNVLKTFRDRNDGVTVYHPGEVIDIEDEMRVEDLIRRGLCEKPALNAAKNGDGVQKRGAVAVGSEKMKKE